MNRLEDAPKDGTVIILQFVRGLIHHDRKAYWSGDAFGWMYEEWPHVFAPVPAGWMVQWWRYLTDEEKADGGQRKAESREGRGLE